MPCSRSHRHPHSHRLTSAHTHTSLENLKPGIEAKPLESSTEEAERRLRHVDLCEFGDSLDYTVRSRAAKNPASKERKTKNKKRE